MKNVARAYRLFSTERFPLPSEDDLEALETRINVSFPEHYRQFIVNYNGGYFNEPQIVPPDDDWPTDGLTFLNGMRASHPCAELGSESDLRIFDDNDPPCLVPIGHTIMGNLLLLVTDPTAEDYCGILLKTFTEYFYMADTMEEFCGLLHAPVD